MHACSVIQSCLTRWTVAHQAPLSKGLSRQEYWSRLPFPPSGELPDPGIKPMSLVSPALQADSLLLSHQGNIVIKFSSVQWLSCVWLLATPWTVARQASLSITNSRSLLTLMSIELVMPSNHLILCHPLRTPAFNLSQHQGSFPMSQFFASHGQSIGVSVSASILPMNTQDWFT